MSDLSVKILEQIRDDIRGLREDTHAMGARLDATNATLHSGFEMMGARFEVVETTLRDLAQQLVMLARGVKVAIDHKSANEERLSDHDRRIAEIERRLG